MSLGSERRVLVSLGGNAILPGRGPGTIEDQFRVTRDTVEQVTDLLQQKVGVLITHGNGPIVGNILLRNEMAKDRIPPMPLDVCGADSQGGIGYMIQQSLENAIRARGLSVPVSTVVTQVLVDSEDRDFARPNKPIGPFYSEAEAQNLKDLFGWHMVEDSGRGRRRVVPSPRPLRVIEESAIRTLFETGHVVIAGGGGGIPVVEQNGELVGVEAVVDKDRTAVLLARIIGADTMINITAVDRVAIGYGTAEQVNLETVELDQLRRYHAAGEFPEGSMGPKIEAAIEFLESGGREVIITSPPKLAAALRGKAGTRIVSRSSSSPPAKNVSRVQ